MQLKSIQEIETLKATIRKVDAEIMHRRLAIRNNTVANAGIARNEVEVMARQQQQRKAYLHTFRGQIEALYRADGGRFNRMRTSFVQKPTPKSQRVSINDLNRQKRNRRQPQVQQTPPTSKQRKKISKPVPSIDMKPMPMPLPAKPPQQLKQAADSARQDAHILAAERAKTIRKQLDAKRDAELVSQGKAKLVAQRRASEAAKKQEEMKKALSRKTTQLTNKVTKRAASAERSARSMASRFSNKKISKSRISRGRFQPTRRRSRGTGLVPQLAVMMSLTDKRRAATVNQVTRTPDKVIPGPIKDQITEDIRQHKPVKQTRSTEYLNFVKEVQTAEKEGHKMIQDALAGREVMGFKIDLEVLGPQRTQYWTSRAYALMAQVKRLVLDEAIRWDQGAFNSGVAVSTDTRSQSKRKMTLNDFKMHLGRKLQPIIEPVFNEFMEEAQRAQMTSSNTTQPAIQSNKTITPAQATHLKQTQELISYKAYYQEQSEKWLDDFKRTHSGLYQKLMKVPMFVNHLTYPQQRRTQMINLFSARKLSQNNALAFAKAEIEFGWKGMIPLAVSEVRKLDPSYTTTLPNPMPQNRKRPLSPYGQALGAFGTSRNINTPVNVQRHLSGIDKLRGHSRPVLSEQQGTKGLAGLFPALRSSMQGALKR